jgi:calpain-7
MAARKFGRSPTRYVYSQFMWYSANAFYIAATHHLRLNYKTNDPSRPNTNPIEINNNRKGDSTETEIWILLTRHLYDTRRTSEYIAMNVQEDDMVSGDPEHVALRVRFFLSAAPFPFIHSHY